MNSILKIKDSTGVGFSSDFHFNHNKPWIIQARGFESIEDHNQAVLDSLSGFSNVFFMGDFSLNCSEEECERLIDRLSCHISMIWGNHNSPLWNIYRREVRAKYGEEIEVYPFTYKKITFLGNQAMIQVEKQIIVLNHFPLQIWDYQKHGAVHCCGHSHGSFKETLPDFPNGKRLDVGWDVFRKPLTFNELMRVTNKKKIVSLDHHA